MKRSALKRRTPLRRSARSRADLRLVEPVQETRSAEREWKTPTWGRCDNCGWISVVPLHGHHVVARPILRRIDPDLEFDPRVRMNLCESCHMNHEFGQENRKISIEKVPEAALAFAVDVLGEAQAAEYLRRRYAP